MNTQNPRPFEVATEDGPIPSHLWLPEGGPSAGIVLLQEIFGVSSYVKSRAADLAALGYAVVAPEIYWRLHASGIDESSPDMLQQGMEAVSRLDWARAVLDARAAVAALRAVPECDRRVGILGFCFGGGLGYAAASAAEGEDRPDALVSYYGSALPGLVDTIPLVNVPSLHHFGLSDSYIPADMVAHIESIVTSVPGVDVRTYPGADHAFDNTNPMFHHAQASAAAWQETIRWLAEHLPATLTEEDQP